MSARQQLAFSVVAPALRAALVIGAVGGFLFALVISLGRALHWPLGRLDSALVQAHGHAQLLGWAGLFVLGVAVHVAPRLRGAPLRWPRALPWIWTALVAGVALRLLCQPLAAVSDAVIWRVGMVASGVLELVGLWTLCALLVATFLDGPALAARPGLRAVLPWLVIALLGLLASPALTLAGVAQAARSPLPLLPARLDEMTVAVGILGILVPVALAMTVRFLPLYARLEPFPPRLLVLLQVTYIAGLVALPFGVSGIWPAGFGVGHLLLGSALAGFAAVMLWLIARRATLPKRLRALAHDPDRMEREYAAHRREERAQAGPFAALVGLAFFWLLFGGVVFVVDGLADLLGAGSPLNPDAARHSLALGFIALLICGIAPRLVPPFSGRPIRSFALVTATLWFALIASVTRIGAALSIASFPATSLALLAISGICGLVLAWLLLINLWPALPPRPAPGVKP